MLELTAKTPVASVLLPCMPEPSNMPWTPTTQTGVPPGVQAKVVRDETAHTTTYEIAIPWSTLGFAAEDRLLSTTVVINENDGTGRRGWLTWGKGVAETKNPALFNAVRLAPEAAH